jgi:hexosaminidase
MMLDVSRHFFPVDFIKKFIDILALHKINTFHWHLTDDQGWRVEIKRYPKLTEIGAYRDETIIERSLNEFDEKRYGGYYTQAEIKDIIEYAQKQHITIIPEIDMPGHIMAALASYNELGCTNGPYEVGTYWGVYEDVLCAGSDFSYEFIEGVLEEITELFPSEYIHVGGDECPKTRWEECPKCQAKIKELNLKENDGHSPEEQLQSHIIFFAGKVLEKHGRKLIGWDEILEGGLPEGSTVMSWRGMRGGIKAAKSGHNVIMTPNNYVYFNFYQDANIKEEPLTFNYLPLEKVYSFELIPSSLSGSEKKYIKGGQANLWTEYVVSPDIAEYQLLPRMAAISEVLWAGPDKKNYKDFQNRLLSFTSLYETYALNYAKHIFNVKARYLPDFSTRQINVVLESAGDPEIYYTLDGTEVTNAAILYSDTIQVESKCTLKAVAQRPGRETRLLDEMIHFNKATLRPIEMLTPINDAFKFNGAQTLVDGLKGQANYNTGRWIGVHNRNLEALIDLESQLEISSLKLSTCVIMSRTAFDARSLSIFGSTDGVHYELISRKDIPPMKITDEDVSVYNHELQFSPVKTRWVKVVVESEKSTPEWHEREGAPGWLFVDEIEIE